MKRASRNRQYNSNSVDEEAMARLKHQSLLQEFLELQKVSLLPQLLFLVVFCDYPGCIL